MSVSYYSSIWARAFVGGVVVVVFVVVVVKVVDNDKVLVSKNISYDVPYVLTKETRTPGHQFRLCADMQMVK